MGKEATNQETQNLEEFNWDTTSDSDFFGIEGTAIPAPAKETKKKEGDPAEEEEEDTPPAEEEETEEGEETFFGQKVDEDNTPPGEEKDDDEEDKDDFYSTLSKSLKEKGVFQNIELPEGEEITEEKFFEFQESEVEARVEEALEGFLEELDEDGAAFLKFKQKGGDTAEFFKTYNKGTGVPEGNLEDEAYQETVNRYYYKNVEGLDEDDINDRIEWLKDSGKLQKYAEKHDTKIKEEDKKLREDLQAKADEREQLLEKKRQEFVDSVKEALEKTDEIDNFKFSAKEKKELQAFITKPSIKVAKNRYVTGMQSKLQTALSDPKKMLVLAKLLKNDFDLSDIETEVKTKTTKSLKEDLQRSSTVRPHSQGKSKTKRNLADFF